MYGKALMIPPMKAWKLPKDKQDKRKDVCNSGEYFGQLKKDGFWYTFEKDMEGNCFLFSRVVSEVTGYLSEKSANVPHIIEFLDDRVPNGTIICGEIYYPNKTSKDVSKIMGCDADKAIARQNGEYGLIHFYMFDMLMYDGVNLVQKKSTNFDRYVMLYHSMQKHKLLGATFIEIATAQYENLDEYIDGALESGEEGVVLKLKTGLYVPDKKPAWNWIKFKIEDNADVICMGFEEPTREYTGSELESWLYWVVENGNGDDVQLCKDGMPSNHNQDTRIVPVTKSYANGWIGAVMFGAYDKFSNLVSIGTVSSGLTDSLLEEIKASPDSFIGKPLEVKYMQAYEGALRHPALVRFRDDIPAHDCTMEKIFK